MSHDSASHGENDPSGSWNTSESSTARCTMAVTSSWLVCGSILPAERFAPSIAQTISPSPDAAGSDPAQAERDRAATAPTATAESTRRES